MPGFEYSKKKDKLSHKTLEGVHSALQKRYQRQALRAAGEDPDVSKATRPQLLNYLPYREAYGAAIATLHKKGERDAKAARRRRGRRPGGGGAGGSRAGGSGAGGSGAGGGAGPGASEGFAAGASDGAAAASSAEAAFAQQQRAAHAQHMAMMMPPAQLPASFSSGPFMGMPGFCQPYAGVAPGMTLPAQLGPFGLPPAGMMMLPGHPFPVPVQSVMGFANAFANMAVQQQQQQQQLDPAALGFGVGAHGGNASAAQMWEAQRLSGVETAALAAGVSGHGAGARSGGGSAGAGGSCSGGQQVQLLQYDGQQQQQQQQQQGAAEAATRPIPELQSFSSLPSLWQFYQEGDGTRRSLQSLESDPADPKHRWRKGFRARWNEIKAFCQGVTKVQASQSGSQLVTPGQVVEQFEAHRISMGRTVPQYVKGKEWERI